MTAIILFILRLISMHKCTSVSGHENEVHMYKIVPFMAAMMHVYKVCSHAANA